MAKSSEHNKPPRRRKASALPPQTSEDAKRNHWTIIIYHSGDSSLSEELIWSLKEMVRIGVPPGVEVIVLMDTISPVLYEFSIKQHQSRPLPQDDEDIIFHSPNVTVRRNPPIRDPNLLDEQTRKQLELDAAQLQRILGRINLASSKILRNFVIHTVRNHKAEHYMLILSGHGDGMIGETLLLDEGAKQFMSVPRLNWALSEVVKEVSCLIKQEESKERKADPRIDILGFDACGMLTAEVANLLKEEVQYIVGSEGIMHRAGWPYHLILKYLTHHPRAKPKALANAIVRKVVRYYSDFSRVGTSVDMAAIELKREVRRGRERFPDWELLIKAFRELVAQLTFHAIEAQTYSGRSEDKEDYLPHRRILDGVISSHWYAQSYGSEAYVDLQDFCEQLILSAPSLWRECEAVIEALHKVVKKSCYTGGEFQHSHGLSLYFPWSPTDRELFRYSRFNPKGSHRYILTPFNKDTLWGEFLWEFVYATRRKPRRGRGEVIFMPPRGYRDHISDYYGDKDPQKVEDFTKSPDAKTRNNPPSPRNNPPSPRSVEFIAFAKIKNPSMIFHDVECQKDASETEEDSSEE
jgi:hypothetical protein